MKLNELMEALHTELGQKLLERIRDPEVKASDLNVARQFLKDNDITAIPAENNVLAQLLEELPFDEGTDVIQ
jgi:ABC-type Zn uptake system ZnuABC Zn-binding protein ZnuA